MGEKAVPESRAQQTQNICITFVQCWTNAEAVGLTLLYNHFSKPFVTSNGVKQDGMLSPILFTLYIDKLLNRLRQSKLGCYVGHVCFCR